MWDLIKKYWDIISGITTGVILSCVATFKLEKIQLIYSILILILVSIGVFKIIRQAIEKQRVKKPKKRKDNVIDVLVDGQKPVKAISLATKPTAEGEKLGNLLLDIWKGIKRRMKKIKVWFEKFKGFILAAALGILSIVEMCGGFINQWWGDALTINGVEVIPIVTLVAAIIVGCISNGFTKEQCIKIKALFAKSTTNELVLAEIKKQLKDDKAKLVQFNKIKETKETELENLESQLKSAQNTLDAKKQMLNMTPQLATEEDVQLAANAVVNKEAEIVYKKAEIEDVEKSINNLTTTINALQSQL